MSGVVERPARTDQQGLHPLRFDIRRMDRSPGALEQWHEHVQLPEAMGLEMIHIPAGVAVEVNLSIAAVDEGVYVSGQVTAPAVAECARCLSRIDTAVTVPIADLYAEPGTPAAAGADDDEVRLLDDGHVDLTQALIDAFGLHLDMAPTCESLGRDHCGNSDVPPPDGDADSWEKPLDPRFAELAKKFGRDPLTGKEH